MIVCALILWGSFVGSFAAIVYDNRRDERNRLHLCWQLDDDAIPVDRCLAEALLEVDLLTPGSERVSPVT